MNASGRKAQPIACSVLGMRGPGGNDAASAEPVNVPRIMLVSPTSCFASRFSLFLFSVACFPLTMRSDRASLRVDLSGLLHTPPLWPRLPSQLPGSSVPERIANSEVGDAPAPRRAREAIAPRHQYLNR